MISTHVKCIDSSISGRHPRDSASWLKWLKLATPPLLLLPFLLASTFFVPATQSMINSPEQRQIIDLDSPKQWHEGIHTAINHAVNSYVKAHPNTAVRGSCDVRFTLSKHGKITDIELSDNCHNAATGKQSKRVLDQLTLQPRVLASSNVAVIGVRHRLQF